MAQRDSASAGPAPQSQRPAAWASASYRGTGRARRWLAGVPSLVRLEINRKTISDFAAGGCRNLRLIGHSLMNCSILLFCSPRLGNCQLRQFGKRLEPQSMVGSRRMTNFRRREMILRSSLVKGGDFWRDTKKPGNRRGSSTAIPQKSFELSGKNNPALIHLCFTSSMIFCAASFMLGRERMFRPDSARIFRPSSTLVPSIRTTRGTVRGFSRMASTMPWA